MRLCSLLAFNPRVSQRFSPHKFPPEPASHKNPRANHKYYHMQNAGACSYYQGYLQAVGVKSNERRKKTFSPNPLQTPVYLAIYGSEKKVANGNPVSYMSSSQRQSS